VPSSLAAVDVVEKVADRLEPSLVEPVVAPDMEHVGLRDPVMLKRTVAHLSATGETAALPVVERDTTR